MPRLTPSIGEPIQPFRYQVYIDNLPGSSMYCMSADQPTYKHNPVEGFFRNHTFFVKGRTTWDPITVECYQLEGMTHQELNTYYKLVQSDAAQAIDAVPSSYLATVQLKVLNPQNSPVGTWTLNNAFISDADFNQMSWEGDGEVMKVSLTIQYDYAEYS